MTKALLMSSSRVGQMGYLEHAGDQIHSLLKRKKMKIVFIPFAAVSFSFDYFEQLVKPVFIKLGYDLVSIHKFADMKDTIKSAEAIAVGGGNTFALLKRLYDAEILELIKSRVQNDGVPYIGWSAGSNIANPTICTTNDMPIVQPPSFKALNLIPFQMNPHFIPGKPAGHNGESREERLQEFVSINQEQQQVIAIREGTALLIKNDVGHLLGDSALWFKDSKTIETIDAGQDFELSMIKGGE